MILDSPFGAYHHYSAQLCNALCERREIDEVFFVPIFAERHRSGISEEEAELLDPRVVVDLIVPGGKSRVWRYFVFSINLFRHLKNVLRSMPCLIHIQTGTGLQLLDTTLLVFYRILGIPIVRTVHELTTAERIKEENSLDRWLGKRQLRMADAIIAHNLQVKKRILELSGEGAAISIVPHGHYLVFRKFIPNEKEAEMPFNDPPVALFFGFKRHKGIEIFLQALQVLQEKGFPIRARIVGRINPGDEDLVQKIKHLPSVEINPGYIPNSEIWKIYVKSDFVVLPYIKGTTSGAIHLAYAFKRPVIVSDLDCFRDLVVDGKTGFIVPKGDPSSLADGIIRICQNREERIRMGEAGFQRTTSETYGWEGIAEKTAQVYMETFERRKKKTSAER